ncbi:hypothetical protein CONPUDRAFT_82099 [Coniophora puteana RWD-64-598 SS2]|uniref:Uncharacterized protein n=1 Tax=Coniophora puteana (strain RWD-64-598) TaxID=741705 RepID=A0A5M3MPA6_CONPW|nr:uncharacterized protein CONPUDRAFT_82099 [Coniophora puteana RWD-64-598 SS2]EIW81009.1 hypothetical protein CONPUDRAFT_82099 [Coniophora puteana RWD-64-598 SS2]
MSSRKQAPDVAFSDAVSAFNRAVTTIVNNAQEQARAEVSEATAEARQARRERDDALKSLTVSKKQEATWKQEATNWKSSLEKAELKIKHREETIIELREDASRWKEQCLRLEETSISWKEQFLRVEAERARLAARVEQLVADLAHAGAAPYTPNIRHADLPAASASSSKTVSRPPLYESASPPPESGLSKRGTAKAKSKSNAASKSSRAPKSSRQQADPPGQLPTPTSEYHSGTKRSAKPTQIRDDEDDEDDETSALLEESERRPRSTVIRRVHAVVSVPVKEEELDEDEIEIPILPSTSTSASAGPSISHISRTWKTASSSTTHVSASAPSSSSKGQSQKTANKSATNASSASVNASSTSSSKARKTAPITTSGASASARKAAPKRLYVEVDSDSEGEEQQESSGDEYHEGSDEDELNMRAEPNHKAIYASQPVKTRRLAPTATSVPVSARSAGPAKKAKTTAASTSRRKTLPAKSARS